MKKIVILIVVFMMVQSIPAVMIKPATKSGPVINSKIRQVTVYPGRAMITRELKRSLSPGRHVLEFSGLPPAIEDRSARVKGLGTAVVTILDVAVKRIFLTKKPRTDLTELQEQKQKVQKELLKLGDEKEALTKKEKFLEKLMEKTLESITLEKNPKQLSMEELRKMTDFQEERLNQLYAAKRKINERENVLEGEKIVLNKKIDWSPRGNQKEQKSVFVDVYVKKAGNLKLSLSYLISGASWAPSYDLRVSRPGQKDQLTYSAIVRQTTGEDWKNVKLTLSTAQPMKISRVPDLKPIYLNLVAVGSGMIMGRVVLDDGTSMPGVQMDLTGNKTKRRVTITNEQGKFNFAALPSGKYTLKAQLEGFKTIQRRGLPVHKGKVSMLDLVMSTATLQEEIVVTGKTPGISFRNTPGVFQTDGVDLDKLPTIRQAMIETSDLSKGTLSTRFKVKHLQTVESGKGNKKMAIVNNAVPVEKKYIAVPSGSTHVILNANVTNSSDAPLLTGDMNLFFEGSFINTSRISFRNPGESFDVPLGIDEGIKVERKTIKNDSGKKKKSGVPMGYTINVKNLKQKNITLIVRDQIPVSKNKKVKVLIETITPKQEKASKAEAVEGVLTWKIHLKANQKKKISVKYLIKYPKGSQLDEQ